MKFLGQLLLLITLLPLVACSPETAPRKSASSLPHKTTTHELPELNHYAAYLELRAYTDLSNAVETAQALDAAIAVFLYTPNQDTLTAAQTTWRDAYNAFLRTLIYSKLPIHEPLEWKKEHKSYPQIIALIDTWPIEGGYIDHVPGYPFSGIVNDLTLNLNSDTLLKQHGFADASYASLGFHVLEFMLWGDDHQRSPADFSPQDNTASVVDETSPILDEPQNLIELHEVKIKVQNHHRRRQFIQLVSEQLQKHLQQLQQYWEPSKGYYAQQWQTASAKQKVTALLHASQLLISDELLGKRLNGHSSEFSQSSALDSLAISTSIQSLLLTEGQPNLSSVFPSEQTEALTQQWQENFIELKACHQHWQQTPDIEARQQCRQILIDRLSLLKKSAEALQLPLPDIN